MTPLLGHVGIFFCVKGEVLLHTCPFDMAEVYGEFLNFPQSHAEVWERAYQRRYHVDFDYFPRGRIIYNTVRQAYSVYYDACAAREAKKLAERLQPAAVHLLRDEHYQCHQCNRYYEHIFI